MDTKILESISQKVLLNDISVTSMFEDPVISSTKRARLDVNYSITTTHAANGNNQIYPETDNDALQARRKTPIINRLV